MQKEVTSRAPASMKVKVSLSLPFRCACTQGSLSRNRARRWATGGSALILVSSSNIQPLPAIIAQAVGVPVGPEALAMRWIHSSEPHRGAAPGKG